MHEQKDGGKRVYTFFIYLNDVEEGGETHFPKLNISFEPQQGTAIFWHNLTADRSKAHPNSQHAGMPPVKGVKWAINVWIREHPRHRSAKTCKPNQHPTQPTKPTQPRHPQQQIQRHPQQQIQRHPQQQIQRHPQPYQYHQPQN